MRNLRRDEVEKRLAICEAVLREPALRYRELVARFGTSPAVVRSALKEGAAKWAGMLGKPVPEAIGGKAAEPVTKRDAWEHFSIVVRGRFADGDWAYGTQEQGQADWTTTDAAVLADVLDGFGSDGWELASAVAINHGHAAFTGTWEVLFKRKRRKEEGQP